MADCVPGYVCSLNSFSVKAKGSISIICDSRLMYALVVSPLRRWMVPCTPQKWVVSAPANITTNDRWSNMVAGRRNNRR